MAKYIDTEKLIAEIESRMEDCKLPNGKFPTTTNIVRYEELSCLRNYITSLLQEQPVLPGIEESGIPGKDFIPVEWSDACEQYGKWRIVKQEQPHFADASKMEQPESGGSEKPNYQQPEVDLEKFTEKIKSFQARYKYPESISIKGAMAFMARMFYQYPNVARLWYDSLPKATMDNERKEE